MDLLRLIAVTLSGYLSNVYMFSIFYCYFSGHLIGLINSDIMYFIPYFLLYIYVILVYFSSRMMSQKKKKKKKNRMSDVL